MFNVIGRAEEVEAELDRVVQSAAPALVVVDGRRRIGKTYLVREYLKSEMAFDLVGLHNDTLERQLHNFAIRLQTHAGGSEPIPQTWLEAFGQLKAFLNRRTIDKKRVLFFDEFPWLATKRSGFLAAFEEFGTRLRVAIRQSSASFVVRPRRGWSVTSSTRRVACTIERRHEFGSSHSHSARRGSTWFNAG